MSSPINSTLIVGNLNGACELRTSKAGKPYAQFKLLSVRQVSGKDEECELNCMAFGGLAERIAANARMTLLVSGRMRTERWEYQGKNYSKLVLAIDDAHGLVDLSPATTAASAPEPTPAAVGNDQPPF